MKNDIVLKISLNENITELQKRILMIVYRFEIFEGYCSLKVNEIAEMANVSIVEGVRGFAKLIKLGYLNSSKGDRHKITLGSALINYNLISIISYKKNNNKLYNYKVPLTSDQIEQLTDELTDSCLHIEEKSLEDCITNLTRLPNLSEDIRELGAVQTILTHLQYQMDIGRLKEIDIQKQEIPDPDFRKNQINNVLLQISSQGKLINTAKKSKLDLEKDSKYKKVLDFHIRKSRKETCKDITDDPKELQIIPANEFRLVSITGNASVIYTAGNPPICNFRIKTYSGDIVFVRVLHVHYQNLEPDLKGHLGKVTVQGKVVLSKYHKKKFGQEKIIESIPKFNPVEFLEEEEISPLVDTSLFDAPF